jgi:hypothetical protein
VIISCLLIKKPEGFLKNPIPFFVSNFEGDPDYKAKYRSASFVLKTTDEKTGLMSELRKFLTKRKSTKALMHPVLLIADELLANAFFNAPVDSLGTPTHRNVQRDASFKLSKPVRFFIAHDRKRLVVGCQDDFGSISRTQLLQALSRAYSGKKSRVDAEARSAGLGCKMMIDRSLAFYVVTKKKRQSLVCCALDLGRGQLRAELVPKNVHLCFW